MKKTFLTLIFVLAVFNFGVAVTDNNTAFAVAPGAGDGGCCGSTPSTPSTGGGGGGGGSTPETPTCDLSLNISEVDAIGDAYRVTWNGGPSSATFFINGVEVSDSGSREFNFVGPNYDRFRMVGNNGGVTCQDDVRIIKKVVEVPTCDAFTATPSTLPAEGGTVTLNWSTSNATNATIDGNPVAGNGTLDVEVTADRTFTLDLSNSEGSDSCSAPVTLAPVVHVPTPQCLAFTGSASTITRGGSLTLNWDTVNATQITIDQAIGDVTDIASRSIEVSPIADTVYNLTVIGADGTTPDTSCNVPVTVVDAPVLTCEAFTATPGTLPVGGGNVTLDWTVLNVTSIAIDNGAGEILATDGTDKGTVSGSRSFPITVSTNFTLTAADVAGNTVTCPAPVVVPTVVNELPVCKAFTATPSVLPVGGGEVAFAWEVIRATDVTISPLFGTVGLTGNETRTITESTTFTLTATDADGDTDSCIAPVAVADPGIFSCESNVTFAASATSIRRGQSSILDWTTTGVDTVSISGIDATALNGSEEVTPLNDITYILTATKAGFDPIECPARVQVSSGGGGSPTPRCDLDISATKIDAGDRVTLTWDTSNARELKLTDNFGNILVNTDDLLGDDKDDAFDSSIVVRPTKNTTYTLLVERGSRDRECEVEVEMEDEIVLLESRNQAPLVSGISLTQVPYTGFEAGPAMTIMFYMLLITWALYITYVLVIPKSQLALATVSVAEPVTNEDIMQKAEQTRPDVFAAMPTTSVASAPANLPVMTEVAPVIETEAPVVDEVTVIENQAHGLQALISSDAVRTIAGMTNDENRSATVAKIVADAKGAFPLEDGWVVINQSRLMEITTVATPVVAAAPTGAGSLAEAIVTGNIVAAYEMIGSRPMVALADAAADLDAVYRIRKGATASVSDLLQTETAAFSDEQVAEMIAALTGALDGTYTDEASAVKMAIMKAVKVAA